jgi:Uncharacterised nucleotidyltransferase
MVPQVMLRTGDRAREPAGGTAAGSSASGRSGEPSLKALQLALHKTTEVLANELERPTAIAPEWSPTEWSVARAVAAIHGVSPLLASALRWRGPADWTRFLAQQKAHTATRFCRIQQLLQLIDGGARREGIALVALKGAALHANGVYAAGERPMADVDLLVREAESQRASQLLMELGFHLILREQRGTTFQEAAAATPAALGEHSDNGVQIDLHHRIEEQLPLRAVDISEIVFPTQPHPGLNAYASKAALLIHLLLHAAGALSGRALRLLQLHDIARLARSVTDAEWEQVFHEAERTVDAGERSLWWAFPPLQLAARYCGGVPDRVLARTASHCHWLLKRAYKHKTLSSASLSYLWISAFPGIAWARSPREMLEYAAMRIVPSADTVQLRTTLATVQPRLSGGSWADLSQSRRVLRWVTSRQARHESLQPVSAALRAP